MSVHASTSPPQSLQSVGMTFTDAFSYLQPVPLLLLHCTAYLLEALHLLALTTGQTSLLPHDILSTFIYIGPETCTKSWVLLSTVILLFLLFAYLIKIKVTSEDTSDATYGMNLMSHTLFLLTTALHVPISYILLRVSTEATGVNKWINPLSTSIPVSIANNNAACFPHFVGSIALALLVGWVVMSLVIALLFSDVSLGNSGFVAYPRAFPQVMHWWIRVLIVVAQVMLHNQPSLNVVNCLLGFISLGVIVYFRTHYVPQLDSLQIGTLCAFMFISIANLIVQTMLGKAYTITSYCFGIAGAISVAVLGYFLSQWQFLSYKYLHDFETIMNSNENPKFSSERQAYLSIRYQLWEASMRGTAAYREAQDADQVSKLDVLCDTATEAYPNSASIRSICALSYMNLNGDYTKTLTHLKFAYRCLGVLDIDIRFLLVVANARRYQLIFETYKENSAEFRMKYVSVRKNEIEVKRRTQLFWKMLLRSNVNAERLFSMTENISIAFKRTDTMYKNILRLFPASPILLRAYAHFLSEMNCDFDTAELLYTWAFEMEAGSKLQERAGQSDRSSDEILSLTGLPRQRSRRMALLSESSFSSRAAKFLSTRLGWSLLVLAISASTMFLFTNSLFGVYKQNVIFLHSSGVASHMVEQILLDVQGIRAAHALENATHLDIKRRELEAHSDRLSTIHKQLYLFQKRQLGVLTDYYETPSFEVPAPSNLTVNYYDLVNIFSSSARELAFDTQADFVTNTSAATRHSFIMRYGPTEVAPGLSHAGSLLRDQNQQQASLRRTIFFTLLIIHIVSVMSTLLFILYPIDRSIKDERNSVIKLFKSISVDLASGVLSNLKKGDVHEFEKGIFTEGQALSATPSDALPSRHIQFKPTKPQQPMERVFRRYYLFVLPLLIGICLLNFNISYNVELSNAQVSAEIFLASERLSAANQLHFFYRELVYTKSLGIRAAVGAHVWPEDTLRKMINSRLQLLEKSHFELRFGGLGTTSSIGRHAGQYHLSNDPICTTLEDSEISCDHPLIHKYHIEKFGLDELLFRFLELCKQIETVPHRIEELDFLDWLLSKALYQSMNLYVDETKQLLYTAEYSQYAIYFANVAVLLLLYIRAVFYISATLSSALSRCRALFLMLPDTALDSSPFIREFLATGVATVEEHVLGTGPSMWQLAANLFGLFKLRSAPTSHSVPSLGEFPFICISSTFRITGISRQVESLLGYGSSELLGEDIELIFEKKHEVKGTLKEMFTKGEPAVLPMQKKNMETLSMHVHASKTHDSEYILVLGCDLSTYVNDAKEMLDKAQHFQAIFSTVSEPIIVCSGEGKIQMLNDKAQKLFGYTDSNIKDRSLDFILPHQGIIDLVTDGDKEEYPIPLGRREGSAVNIALSLEGTCLCASGAEIPVEVSITKFWVYRDGPPTIVCFFRDMSMRKQIEKSYMSAQKEKAANVAKSVFLANMSHELRTPLNGIILTSQLLAGANLGPEYQEYIETISCCADSLFSLINDILDFSKIEAGKLEMEDSAFNIAETVEEVVSSVSPHACEKTVELISVIDPQVPRFLRGDSRRLRQVLLNLLSNAVKFTSIGHVLVTNQLKSTEGSIVELIFKVSDTGIGIRDSQVNQLFARFSQLDMSSTRQYHGSGLGLAISKELVNMLGGKIGVDSEFGRGSTFWFTCKFTIDNSVEPNKAKSLESMYAHKLQGIVVIVVVQNLVLSDVICQYLKMWRVRYYTADSLQSAIPHSRANNSVPPIWLADEMFSDSILDSAQNSPVIRIAFPHAIAMHRNALIALQDGKEANDEEGRELSGITDYAAQISKPVTEKKLLEAILTALNKFPATQKRNSEPSISASTWSLPTVVRSGSVNLPSSTAATPSPRTSSTSLATIAEEDSSRSHRTPRAIEPPTTLRTSSEATLISSSPYPRPQSKAQPFKRRSIPGPTSPPPFSFAKESPELVADDSSPPPETSTPISRPRGASTPTPVSLVPATPPDTPSPAPSLSPKLAPIATPEAAQVVSSPTPATPSTPSGLRSPSTPQFSQNTPVQDYSNSSPSHNGHTAPLMHTQSNTIHSITQELSKSSEVIPFPASALHISPSPTQKLNSSSDSVENSENGSPRKRKLSKSAPPTPQTAATQTQILPAPTPVSLSATSGPQSLLPDGTNAPSSSLSRSDELTPSKLKKSPSLGSMNEAEVDPNAEKVLTVKCKVLVAEDNIVNRRVLNLLLQKVGCEVVGTNNGAEALEAFQRAIEQKARFDVILMDCQMPVMDGYRATFEIRKLEKAEYLEPVVIIAVTAHATNSDKQQCIEAGMSDYISKPLRKEHIMNVFGKWMRGEYAKEATERASTETKDHKAGNGTKNV